MASIGNIYIRQYANAADGSVNLVEVTADNISEEMIKEGGGWAEEGQGNKPPPPTFSVLATVGRC